MGLDLILMPVRGARELAESVLGYNRLQFVKDYKIFAQIADSDGNSAVPDEGIEAIVKTHPLPPGIKVGIYRDSGIRNTRKNSYGKEMVYATAGEMRKIVLPKNVSPVNKAIMAYIKALQKDALIVLEWR